MKLRIITTILLATCTSLQAATYYVSSSTGNDANDGLSEAAPMASLSVASALILAPGDQVLFKAGDTFPGQFVVNGSGADGSPIRIASYGTGNKPVLDASNTAGAHYGAIHILNKSYIEIEDLQVSNNRVTAVGDNTDNIAYGIFIQNTSSITPRTWFRLNNLTVRDVFCPSPVDFQNREDHGIKIGTRSVYDVEITNCYFTHTGKAGISVAGSSSRLRDIVVKHNTFFQTGGSGAIFNRVDNALLEHNTFDHTGSTADSRMAKRGSGAWFFWVNDGIMQYNISKWANGSNDSYGLHVDYKCTNIIVQYNYSENNEGFCEILGDNINIAWRYNVSINDGLRSNKGYSIWIDKYSNNNIYPDQVYVYNNTIYVDDAITPDIKFQSKNSYIYNNIFYAVGDAKIGESVTLDIEAGSALDMRNNLFLGNVSEELKALDAAPVIGDPMFVKTPPASTDDLRLLAQSAALNTGFSFPEPEFPMAGQGIFADITLTTDFYENPASVETTITHIGAYNGPALTDSTIDTDPPTPNPATWDIVPAAEGETSITMTATTGTDANYNVFYYFEETSGNPGGSDSGWQYSPSYTDTGLSPDTEYTYVVRMSDIWDGSRNVGGDSSAESATTDATPERVPFTVQIDFEDKNNTPVAGGHWNEISAPSDTTALSDTNGNDAALTLGSWSGFGSGTSDEASSYDFSTTEWGESAQDHFECPGVISGAFTVSGFEETDTVEIRLIAIENNRRDIDFQINGAFGSGNAPYNGDNYRSRNDGWAAGIAAGWTGLTGTNAYTLTATPTDGDVPVISAMRIIVTPAQTDLDTDGDGLPDSVENAIGTDPNNPDSDGDGLDDLSAYALSSGSFSSPEDALPTLGSSPTGVVYHIPSTQADDISYSIEISSNLISGTWYRVAHKLDDNSWQKDTTDDSTPVYWAIGDMTVTPASNGVSVGDTSASQQLYYRATFLFNTPGD